MSTYTTKSPPRLGEGVFAPWGLERVPGEVVEVHDDRDAVVAVAVEGAGGEALETLRARFRIDELEPMSPWRVTDTRRGSPAPGADAVRAWYVEAERDHDRARVEVRVAGSLEARVASVGGLNEEADDALRTNGRSAVEKFAYRYRLPRVIVIGRQGVAELRE